ncbi:MAG: hypothetical protein HYV96_15365 [Opitutae bacterium]|nr:hypothetical protein [Opitutae bacterium]
MSLNRYEQSLFDYWERQPDERRHWQMKTVESAKRAAAPGEVARGLERELWDYFRERTAQVPALRAVAPSDGQRVSMLNLAEFMLRLWGPPPKPKRPSARPAEE